MTEDAVELEVVEVCIALVVAVVLALVRLVGDDEDMDVAEDEIEDVLDEVDVGTDDELVIEDVPVDVVEEDALPWSIRPQVLAEAVLL